MAVGPNIVAKEFVDPSGNIVGSAMLLANEVVRQLHSADAVTIDLSGMRGLSSSYFNVVIHEVLPSTGLADFERRVRLRFDTEAQAQVFARSYEVARWNVA